MTTTLDPESKPSSRRALLAGAIGGLGALAATAIGRPTAVTAHDVDDVALGTTNTSGSTTILQNSTTSSTVLFANGAVGAIGLYGYSDGNTAVYGSSTSYIGVSGQSGSHIAVYGYSFASDQPSMVGWNGHGSTGVQGFSSASKAALPAPPANTGVYGLAIEGTTSKGVWGDSPQGHGIHGSSTSGYAGYFNGKVYASKWYEMTEIAAPPSPGVGKGRLFLRANGSGKTELCVRFNSGAVQILATQP